MRTSQSSLVADLIKSGHNLQAALRAVLPMVDGANSASTSLVLSDLVDMGVWRPSATLPR
jgi:hypothetical protein